MECGHTHTHTRTHARTHTRTRPHARTHICLPQNVKHGRCPHFHGSIPQRQPDDGPHVLLVLRHAAGLDGEVAAVVGARGHLVQEHLQERGTQIQAPWIRCCEGTRSGTPARWRDAYLRRLESGVVGARGHLIKVHLQEEGTQI